MLSDIFLTDDEIGMLREYSRVQEFSYVPGMDNLLHFGFISPIIYDDGKIKIPSGKYFVTPEGINHLNFIEASEKERKVQNRRQLIRDVATVITALIAVAAFIKTFFG